MKTKGKNDNLIKYFSRSGGIKALHITLSCRIVSHKINDLEIISKCRKGHLGDPKFAILSGGTCLQTSLKTRVFGAKS